MRVAAADHSPVDERHPFLGGLRRCDPERLRLRRRIVDVVVLQDAELVVSELRLCQPRPLLEHDYGEPGGGELLRDDAASGAGSDDRKVHRVARLKASRDALGTSLPLLVHAHPLLLISAS